MKQKKRLLLPSLLLSVLLTISLLFSSCGSSTADAFQAEDAYPEDEVTVETAQEAPATAYETDVQEDTEGEPSLTEVAAAVERKIVRTFQVDIETKEYDTTIEKIPALVERHGGYFSYSQVDGKQTDWNSSGFRHAAYTAKIPRENTDAFSQELEDTDSFFVILLQEGAEDITQSYYDNKASIEALEERKARLEDLLEGARDLKTMLEIEREIATTIEEIKILDSRQKVMEQSVAMSTFHIAVSEIVTETPRKSEPLTFGEQMSYAFQSAIQGVVQALRSFALFVTRYFPLLIFLGLVGFGGYKLIGRQRKKRESKEKPSSPKKEAQSTKDTPNDAKKKPEDAPKE